MMENDLRRRSLIFSDHFDSAHYLKNYEGQCANMHGHTYHVEVEITTYGVPAKEMHNKNSGMLIDFSILKAQLKKLLAPLDHKVLNDCPEFSNLTPTAEIIAEYIAVNMYYTIEEYILELYPDTVSNYSVKAKVWETPNNAATYELGLSANLSL